MASKNLYSVDDILSEYSPGENEEAAEAENHAEEEKEDSSDISEQIEPIIPDDGGKKFIRNISVTGNHSSADDDKKAESMPDDTEQNENASDEKKQDSDNINKTENENTPADNDSTDEDKDTYTDDDDSDDDEDTGDSTDEGNSLFTENITSKIFRNSSDTALYDLKNRRKEGFSGVKTDFSYRSATRIQDKPNKIVRNPEDNIRYAPTKESRPSKKTSDSLYKTGRKNTSVQNEPDSDISILKHRTPNLPVTEIFGSLKEKALSSKTLSGFKKRFSGSGGVTQKNHSIDLKSTPEVGYFSIDVDITDDYDKENQKHSSFFKKTKETAENSLNDYEAPGDASIILEDLYSLKDNLTAKGIVQIIAAMLSTYLSVSVMYNIPVPGFVSNSASPHAYSFVMFLLSAIVMFTSFPVITGGIRNLFRKKADCDSLAAIAITFSTIAAAISTENAGLISTGGIHIYTPVAITAFLANTIGKHFIVNRAINNFDMLMSSSEKYSLFYIDDEARSEQLTKGVIHDYPVVTAVRKTGFAKDFLRYTYSSDIADKLCGKTVPIILAVSLFMTVIAVFLCGELEKTLNISFITSVLSMSLSACSCFGIPIVVNLPLANTAAEAEENESMILGYQSIDDFYDTNALVVDASQIIPEHSVKLCAIKMFSGIKIDKAIVSAASLVIKSGSIFSDMFSKIIDHNEKLLEKVENYSYEDSMGICGWIKNKRVLFGNRQLMINHNIEGIPPKSREQELVGKGRIPVYLSISGNLAAIFVIKLKADSSVTEDLTEITNNGVSLIVKSIDSVVTVTRIARLHNIPEDMIKVIPTGQREYCEKITSPVSETSASVICSGKLSSVSRAISNIKHIHHSSLTGLVLQGTSAIIAMFFILIFMFMGIESRITPLMIMLYHAIWLFSTVLIMKLKPR